MRINSEHVLKPRNIKIEEHDDRNYHHHAEIRQIIQQFGSRTENITITNE